MKKGKRKPTHRPSPPTSRGTSRSRTLVLVDEVPLRADGLQKYHALEDKIAKTRTLLDTFETIDRPAYQRWEAQAFGALLTEFRDLSMELQKTEYTFAAIEDEMYWSGCTEVTAYRRVMKMMSEPPPETGAAEAGPFDDGYDFDEEPPPGPEGDKMFGASDLPPEFDIKAFDAAPANVRRDFREFYADTAELYEIMTGRRPPKLDDLLREARARARGETPQERPAPEAEPAKKRGVDRLKELYRQLVMQLHPDHHGTHTPRERELWHQLQAAYRAGDLEMMEALAGRVELTAGRANKSVPLQVLRRLIRELQISLGGLQKQVSVARKDPAWNFSEKTAELARMEATRRKALQRDLQRVRTALERNRAELEFLAQQAARSGRRRTKKRARPAAAQQSVFDF